MGPLVTYDLLTRDTTQSARGPAKQWPGTTGDVGDPLIDQLVAAANSTITDNTIAENVWRQAGAELLDRIGPAILVTHSAGGPFGWLVANERPKLVKAVVSFEGGTAPLVGTAARPARPLPNLKGLPIMYLIADNSPTFRPNGAPLVAAASALGANAELIDLRARGIRGNSHFAMFENNRQEVLRTITGWIEQRVPAAGATA
jgi:pimeloyl-ACP methyl ester carboxylesterase